MVETFENNETFCEFSAVTATFKFPAAGKFKFAYLWFFMFSTFLKTLPHTSQKESAPIPPPSSLCVLSWMNRLYCFVNDLWQKRQRWPSEDDDAEDATTSGDTTTEAACARHLLLDRFLDSSSVG
jgi:hypothetical protein